MSDDLTPEEEEEERRAGRGRRTSDEMVTVQVKEKVLTPTFILLCVAVLMSSLGALGVYIDNRQGREIAEDTKTIAERTQAIVEDIERQQSPEAQAAQEARLNRIIQRVACNDQRTLEEFAKELSRTLVSIGIIPEGFTVDVSDEACPPDND